MDGALRASADAGRWTNIGSWIGVGLLALDGALIALGGGGAIFRAAALE